MAPVRITGCLPNRFLRPFAGAALYHHTPMFLMAFPLHVPDQAPHLEHTPGASEIDHPGHYRRSGRALFPSRYPRTHNIWQGPIANRSVARLLVVWIAKARNYLPMVCIDGVPRIISGQCPIHICKYHSFYMVNYASQPLRLVPIPDVVGSQGPGMVTSEKHFRHSPSQSSDTSLNHASNHLLRFSNKVVDGSSASISVLPVLLSTFGSRVLRKIAVATTLDTTPHAHLETALLALQSSIPAGNLALLEFTSIESAPSIWSNAWLLSALPCFYRVSDCSKPCQRLIPVPPLRNGLSRVITLLESGPQSCVILSVQNVSTPQAQLLNDYACMLDGRAGRQRFLAAFSDLDNNLALRAWRAEMFLARWEAACYACGSLGRWVICMRRPMG